MYQVNTGASAKKQLFCKLWFAGLACGGMQMCCFVGGVSSFFARGEKKQNKFPQAAPHYRSLGKLRAGFRRVSVSPETES